MNSVIHGLIKKMSIISDQRAISFVVYQFIDEKIIVETILIVNSSLAQHDGIVPESIDHF
jgi:hypothetical protein